MAIAPELPSNPIACVKPREHLADQCHVRNNRIARKRSHHWTAEHGASVVETPEQRGKCGTSTSSECDAIDSCKNLDTASSALGNDGNPVSYSRPLILDDEIA